MIEPRYWIEIQRDGLWTTEGLGDPEANAFNTYEEAESALSDMIAADADWGYGQFRIEQSAQEG
jgi:hypothetical protein